MLMKLHKILMCISVVAAFIMGSFVYRLYKEAVNTNKK